MGMTETVETQGLLRRRMRRFVVDKLGGDLDPTAVAQGVGLGWFGPESSAWKIHEDSCLLIGGIAALLHQTLHPLAMAGVMEHSSYALDPWGRLRRTSAFLTETIYGDAATADRNVERVRCIHTRIVGTAPDGRAYRADDPELLLYIHATEVRAFLRSYQQYGARTLSGHEADRYVSEMGRIATALGATNVPDDQNSLNECLAGYKTILTFGPQAAEALRFLRNPGLAPLERVAYQGIFDAGCALLGEFEAELLGVTREQCRGLALRSGSTVAAGLRWVFGPSRVIAAAKQRASACTN